MVVIRFSGGMRKLGTSRTGKGAPFSLCAANKYFSRVGSAVGNKDNGVSELNGVMKAEYSITVRSELRSYFAYGVQALLVDKDQKPNWNPLRVEDVDPSEVKALFKAIPPRTRGTEGMIDITASQNLRIKLIRQ
ncbi:hypothetical protein MKX01_010167 [Papaver californicum]|nr:hypothetical protein MKX01_010167 [Papaver californicum]